jgi:23S rRNA (uracil1939-C5)-methyltransferase
MTSPETLDIVRIGAQGDGVAETPAGPLHVPFALPGETWTGPPYRRHTSSPLRQQPVCRHFERCGGCAAQHMAEPLYSDWKREIVVRALRHRGIDAEVAPLRRVGPGSRRRCVLTARRTGGRVELGYRADRSHDLVDLAECPVLRPEIVAAFDGLRAIAAAILAPDETARLTLLVTAAGLDVAVDTGLRRQPAPALRMTLAQLAAHHRIARLTLDGAPLAEHAPVSIMLGAVAVSPEPGAFVQAVPEAEAVMSELVLSGLAGARTVADLFAGLGTFSFAIARGARVLAVDGDKAAIARLAAAARAARGLKPIETRVRDLYREPLSRKELEPYDAVVLDPPRAGAKAQSEALARSKVRAIVAVSCNPATLARDMRILVDGGCRIEKVAPIDQFLFSAHVEVVALLRR